MELTPVAGRSQQAIRQGVEAGDIAPRFRLPDQAGHPVDLQENDVLGRPIILVFCGGAADSQDGLAQFARIDSDVAGHGARIIAIRQASAEENARLCGQTGIAFSLLADPEGQVFAQYGLKSGPAGQGTPVTFVLNANQHVVEVLRETEPGQAELALAAVETEADQRRTRLMEPHPPVLIVPGVFSRDDCRRLITIFNMDGNVWVEPGHGDKGMTSDYKMRVPEYGRKDRIDHWVINTETRDFISARLQARLFPEIKKSFQYRITKAETYRIGCYEGERGGDLHGHRDNTSPLVAHRRFAVSINLNTEEFEGGELRFPEFGDQRYRPETGAAIGFSCSLYHEAMHVTAGRRYVLLAFVFGDH